MRKATTVFLALLAILGPRAAQAQWCRGNNCFFGTADCVYGGSDTITFGSYDLTFINFWGFLSPCIPFPPPGSPTTTAITATADFRLSQTEYYCSGPTTVQLTTSVQNGEDKTVQSEVTQVDLSGGSLPAGMLLRESPTLQSTGQVVSTEYGPGTFDVASSFDLFLELSTDSGQTWLPGSGPEHLVLVPGVATQPTTWGSVKATYR